MINIFISNEKSESNELVARNKELTIAHGEQHLLDPTFFRIKEYCPSEADEQVCVLFKETRLVEFGQRTEGIQVVGYPRYPLHTQPVQYIGVNFSPAIFKMFHQPYTEH